MMRILVYNQDFEINSLHLILGIKINRKSIKKNEKKEGIESLEII